MKQKSLEYVWQVYSNLHQQALQNKNEVLRWKKFFMFLTITTATLGTLAGYLQTFHLCLPKFIIQLFNIDTTIYSPCFYTTEMAQNIGNLLGLISTIMISAIAYYGSKLMLSDKEILWTKARSLSEALKSKIYLFCTNKGEFAGLNEQAQIEIILNRADEYLKQANEIILENTISEPNMPDVKLSVDQYIATRFNYQKNDYYRKQSMEFKVKIKKYERLTIALGFISVVFSGLVTVYDASVLIALITTVTTSINSYYTALKLKDQMNQFNSTANQLEILYQRYNFSQTVNEDDFIVQSEHVLNAENTAWMSMWVK